MKSALLVVAAALVAFAAPAHAQTDAFARCLADNTTGKDRKQMVRWIFIGLAAHPEIKDLTNVTPTASDEASRAFGEMVTRLITENCKEEVKAVVAKGDSQAAFKSAFENLGRLAVMEIVSNPDVAAAMARFQAFIDKDKFRAVFGGN